MDPKRLTYQPQAQFQKKSWDCAAQCPARPRAKARHLCALFLLEFCATLVPLMSANTDVIPYVTLACAILAAWKTKTRLAIGLIAMAIVFGLATDRLAPVSLTWILLLGLSLWLPDRMELKGWQRNLSWGGFLATAVGLSLHTLPGFNNLLIFKQIQFSPDSMPYSLYLNFDKPLVGLTICLLYLSPTTNSVGFIARQAPRFSAADFRTTMAILATLVVLMIPLALWLQYVRLDLKTPHQAWIWALNNLLFVCVAEESLFRGFIQKELAARLPRNDKGEGIAIGIAATIFGLAHYSGGFIYMSLATASGIFYGYAFHKTNRLESPILVHFGLNLVHFTFFSYPALIP